MFLLLAVTVFGCGDTDEDVDVLQEGTAVGVFADAKYPDAVAAAPSALPAGTPSVKEVSFYHDWKLTKPVTAPVSVGDKVFIHLTFSEPMKHVVSDGKEARPILYYKRAGKGEELVRFKMAFHGAGGEDFVSGDAKPYRSGTDDYVCKYTVVPEDAGKGVAVMVGRWSVDLQGTPLSAFYRHGVKLLVDVPVVLPEPIEDEPVVLPDPVEVHPPMPTVPTEVVDSITHGYYLGVIASDILPPSAWVLDFPGPFRHYDPPRSSPRDFVGRVCMPLGRADRDNWASTGGVAPVSGVIVTITDGVRAGEQVLTDDGGYYLFKDVPENELYLRVEKAYLEPKEVIVSRSRPTTLQRLRSNHVFIAQHHVQERTPGTILMGLRWSDAVRFILNNETLPHDVLCIETLRMPDQMARATSGLYGDMVVQNVNRIERKGDIGYGTLAHELAHARQHAIAVVHGGSHARDWERTPEGQAYREAWEQDLQNAPRGFHLPDDSEQYRHDLLENAAEFCSHYWQLRFGIGLGYRHEGGYQDNDILRGLKQRAPNRFKWAETYLNTRY